MALPYIFRNLPKYAQLSRNYCAHFHTVRSASVLTSFKHDYQNTPSAIATCNKGVNPLPSYLKSSLDCSQVKAFSVTSSKLSAGGHDHTKLWSAERIVSATLLGIVPAAFVFPSQAMDTLLAVSLVMHNHWGIEAIVIDYIRPNVFGSVISKVAIALTYGLSIATLVGLFYLIYTGSGLVNSIQLLWGI